MHYTWTSILIMSVLLGGCVGTRKRNVEWPAKKYDLVVGYQFVNPGGMETPFFGIHGELLTGFLKKLKRKEIILNSAQTEQLLEAIFSSDDPNTQVSKCYDPHHIFIFYSAGQEVGAFEVCFRCDASKWWPHPQDTVNESYPKLRALCMELGLGIDAPPDQETINRRHRDQRRMNDG